VTQDGDQIYIVGHAMQSTLTGDSNTYNIFLQKVKASDGTNGFTVNWGLDGVGQDDFATGLTINPDGGKILIVG
jgi:hypothetical protein